MFDRIGKLIKGFFSLFISNLEKANPKALLEAEVQSFHQAIGTYNTNLAKQAGMIEKIREQLKRQQREADTLKARAAACYNAKQMEEAGRLALALKQINADIAENENQMNQADELYKNLVRQRDTFVRDAQRRIEAIKQKMSRVDMAESQARLAEIASATAYDMSGSGATLQRIEEGLDERYSLAAGKARVAADMAKTGEWSMKAEQQSALEQQALAEFASSMGLASPAPAMPVDSGSIAASAPPLRDLGPAETAG